MSFDCQNLTFYYLNRSDESLNGNQPKDRDEGLRDVYGVIVTFIFKGLVLLQSISFTTNKNVQSNS